MMTLPRSMRLTVPVTQRFLAREEVLQDLLALRVADRLQHHLLRGLRADAAELDRLERLLDVVADVQVLVAILGIGDGDLVALVLDVRMIDDLPAAPRLVVAASRGRSRRARRRFP